MTGFPRDPLISRHPAPLTARQAREEVRRAAQLRRRVPLAHPFGVLPLWTPYPLARLVSRLLERSRPTPSSAVKLKVAPALATEAVAPPPTGAPVAAARRRQAFAQRWTA